MKVRPKRIKFTISWKWTNAKIMSEESPYDPLEMSKGMYRKRIEKLKKIFLHDEDFRQDRAINGNKLQTKIEFIN